MTVALWIAVALLVVGISLEVRHQWTHRGSPSRKVIAVLRDAAEAHPVGCPLLDQTTGSLLFTERRKGMWAVSRYPVDRMAEATADLRTGDLVSTYPVYRLVVGRSHVAGGENLFAIRRDGDSQIEPVELPWLSLRQIRQAMRFRRRMGVARISPEEVAELTAQLRRAEPVDVDGMG